MLAQRPFIKALVNGVLTKPQSLSLASLSLWPCILGSLRKRCHQLSGAWANHTWTQTSGRLPLLWRHLPPFLPISSRMECYDMLASCAIPHFFGTTIFGHHNNPHSQRNLSQGLSCESSPLHPGGQVMSLFGKSLPFLSVSDLWGRSPRRETTHHTFLKTLVFIGGALISGRMASCTFWCFRWLGGGWWGGMLTFAELVHATHALVLRFHA